MISMQSISRRYTSPATKPVLNVRESAPVSLHDTAPLVCLRCGFSGSTASTGLVTFAWGGLTSSRSRR
jgi:hypothetical protein